VLTDKLWFEFEYLNLNWAAPPKSKPKLIGELKTTRATSVVGVNPVEHSATNITMTGVTNFVL